MDQKQGVYPWGFAMHSWIASALVLRGRFLGPGMSWVSVQRPGPGGEGIRGDWGSSRIFSGSERLDPPGTYIPVSPSSPYLRRYDWIL